MKFIATSFPIGILLLLTQAQEPGRKAIHLIEITCKAFVGEMKREEHSIIVAWLQGYYLHEHPVIDVDKLSLYSAKLREHCLNNSEDDLLELLKLYLVGEVCTPAPRVNLSRTLLVTEAQCSQPAEADISPKWADSSFDPKPSLTASRVVRCLTYSLTDPHQSDILQYDADSIE
jgi:hypothetical protein